jgi:hypothetical protein
MKVRAVRILARTTNLVCDICHQPTKRIVAKLNYVPVIEGISRAVHSNYSHHCDVGECCNAKLMRGFHFRQRLTAAEYHESRRAGTG